MKKKHLLSDIISANALFLVVALCFFLAWRSYNLQVSEGRASQVVLMGELVKDRYSRIVEQNIFTLRNLATRIENTDGVYFQYWKSDAAIIVDQNPSFSFVEFIDSNMVVQDVVPEAPNQRAIGLNIGTIEYRKHAWIESTESNITNITPWSKLVQGTEAFLVDEPITVNNQFWGTITAGLDFRGQVNEIFEEQKGFHMHLLDQANYQFYCSDESNCKPITVDSALIYQRDVTFDGMKGSKWSMILYPNDEFFDGQVELANLIGFIISLILSISLAVAFYFILRNGRQKRNISLANARLKELNITLDKQKKKAQEASKTKSEFLSNMSHEIRTPINVITGLISLLKETDLNTDQADQVSMLESSSKDLLGLVNNILEIERIEAGKVAIVKQAFEPYKRVVSLMKNFEGSFQEKGLYLKFEDKTDSNERSVLIGDEVKFGQVLSNLIRNAFKFTKEGGVTVIYEEENLAANKKLLKVSVKDTGIGIPKDLLNQVFERFTQVESGYTKNFEGSGLGLAISKSLVEMQGGHISVNSTESEGTTFVVEIPMLKTSVNVSKHEEAELDLSKLSGRRLLVAEDNQLNILVLQKMLSTFGFEFETAQNGQEAVNKAREQKFDMILMDIHMPIMDGIEATKQIRINGFKEPIIGLSANVTRETMDESMSAGMNAYITKPISKEQLIKLFLKHF